MVSLLAFPKDTRPSPLLSISLVTGAETMWTSPTPVSNCEQPAEILSSESVPVGDSSKFFHADSWEQNMTQRVIFLNILYISYILSTENLETLKIHKKKNSQQKSHHANE